MLPKKMKPKKNNGPGAERSRGTLSRCLTHTKPPSLKGQPPPVLYRGKRERKMPLRTWSCHVGLLAALLAYHADVSVEGFCSSTAASGLSHGGGAVASFSAAHSSHVRRPRKVRTGPRTKASSYRRSAMRVCECSRYTQMVTSPQ